MMDHKNRVIETISKNIIFIKGNKIYSPILNKCGVYGVALRWLQSVGYEINWQKIALKKIHKYHAMMVCNSIIGFQKITQINEDIELLEDNNLICQISEKWQESINP
jgi:4-amino-4-deoxychorismate lyase